MQSNRSIFNPIHLENDQGNDCLVEFVINDKATNYGVFVQIKSGKSFKDSRGYKVSIDKAHLEYWKRCLYPVAVIVYDPSIKKAFWISVNDYLKANPQIVTQTHTIRISPQQEFSKNTFSDFTGHFIQYTETFRSYENFGRSLELFSQIYKYNECKEGLKSLYFNHRDKPSSWFYIISNFGKIKEKGIRKNIIGLISNNVDNPHIFWHKNNMQYYSVPGMQKQIAKMLSTCFGIKELKLMLPYLREGVSVGSFSYAVFQVVDMIENVHLLMKEFVFTSELDPDDRNHLFWLYMHIAKYYSTAETLQTTNECLKAYPSVKEDEALIGLKESIEKGQLYPIGQF